MVSLALKVLTDLTLSSLAALLAFMLRLPVERWGQFRDTTLVYLVVAVPVKAILLAAFRLSHQRWTQIGAGDLWAVFRAVGVGALIVMAVAFIFSREHEVWSFVLPRSIPLIDAALSALLLCGVRLAARVLGGAGSRPALAA